MVIATPEVRIQGVPEAPEAETPRCPPPRPFSLFASPPSAFCLLPSVVHRSCQVASRCYFAARRPTLYRPPVLSLSPTSPRSRPFARIRTFFRSKPFSHRYSIDRYPTFPFRGSGETAASRPSLVVLACQRSSQTDQFHPCLFVVVANHLRSRGSRLRLPIRRTNVSR